MRYGEQAVNGAAEGEDAEDLKLWKWRCQCGNTFVAPHTLETCCPGCERETVYIVGEPPEDLDDQDELLY